MVPRYPKRKILNRAKTRQHMSFIGFDGKLETAFFQHVLIGRVEHQPFQCGMDELEPMYAYVYMYMLHVLFHVVRPFFMSCVMTTSCVLHHDSCFVSHVMLLRVMPHVMLFASKHVSFMSCFMTCFLLHVMPKDHLKITTSTHLHTYT